MSRQRIAAESVQVIVNVTLSREIAARVYEEAELCEGGKSAVIRQALVEFFKGKPKRKVQPKLDDF